MTTVQPDPDDDHHLRQAGDPPAASANLDVREPIPDDEITASTSREPLFPRERSVSAGRSPKREAVPDTPEYISLPTDFVGAGAFDELARMPPPGARKDPLNIVFSSVERIDAAGAVTVGALMYSHLRLRPTTRVELWEPKCTTAWQLVGSFVGLRRARVNWCNLLKFPKRDPRVMCPALELDDEVLIDAMRRVGVPGAVRAGGVSAKTGKWLSAFMGELASNTAKFTSVAPVMSLGLDDITGMTTLAFWDAGPGLSGFEDPVDEMRRISERGGGLVDLAVLAARSGFDVSVEIASSIARASYDSVNGWQVGGPKAAAVPGFAVAVSLRE